MPNRLRNIPIKKTNNGIKYRINTIYPEIPPTEDDIYIITSGGDRYDILALQFYNDSNLWWIIASANNQFQASLNIKPGIQLRIPANKDEVINQFERSNKNR